MKKIFIGVLSLITLLLISACGTTKSSLKETLAEITGNSVVCNKPYILVGKDCCLDRDYDNICDKDEPDQIIVGCGNKICERGESCNSCEKDCGKCFYASELQKDLTNAVGRRIFLIQQGEDSDAEFYIHSEWTAKLLGKYSGFNKFDINYFGYYKVMPKIYFLVSHMKNKLIENDDEFYQYVLGKEDLILKSAADSKTNFQEDFKSDRFKRLIFEVDARSGDETDSREFVKVSKNKETLLFENLSRMETGKNRLVESYYISTNDYEVVYNITYRGDKNSRFIVRPFSGINYEHAISIYCSPSIIITLYQPENYKNEDYTSHLREKSFFYDDIFNSRISMLQEATAILRMCDTLYDFKNN